MIKLLQHAINASIKAGNQIMEVYAQNDFQIQLKSDESPLTIADKKAHLAIIKEIEHLNIPILSEEGKHDDYSLRKNWKQCWIIDPLDGTKEFIQRNNEFTVNIALVKNGTPILGVIYIPVYKTLYFATKDLGAYKTSIEATTNLLVDKLLVKAEKLPVKQQFNSLRVVGSRSHMNKATEQFIQNLKDREKPIEIISKGSSLKLCMIAEGKADIYPRFAPTMEWDIAAGHAIINAAGGKVLHAEHNRELTYNKTDLLNPYFIATKN